MSADTATTYYLDGDYIHADPGTLDALEAAIREAAYDCGWDMVPELLNYSYSGRSMYGATCVAWTGDLQDFLLALATRWTLAERYDLYDLRELLGELRSDSMGLGTVWYWPALRTYATTVDYDNTPSLDVLNEGGCGL